MELDTTQLLQQAVQAQASDVFIVAGLPVSMALMELSQKKMIQNSPHMIQAVS